MSWTSSAFGGFPAQKELKKRAGRRPPSADSPLKKSYRRRELDVVRLRRIPRSKRVYRRKELDVVRLRRIPRSKKFIEEMSWTSSPFGGFPAQIKN
jgi:hypothetical protein